MSHLSPPDPGPAVQLPRLGGYLRSMNLIVRGFGEAFSDLMPQHPKYPRARWRRCWAGFAHMPEDRWWMPMLRCRREAGHSYPHYARRRKSEAWW